MTRPRKGTGGAKELVKPFQIAEPCHLPPGLVSLVPFCGPSHSGSWGSTPAPGVAGRAARPDFCDVTDLSARHLPPSPGFSARARKNAPGAGALPFRLQNQGQTGNSKLAIEIPEREWPQGDISSSVTDRNQTQSPQLRGAHPPRVLLAAPRGQSFADDSNPNP
jgi:hypothetical protein